MNQDAKNVFSVAIKFDSKCVPALAGLATALFRIGEYAEALDAYQKVLSLDPNSTPDVRIAIGICFSRLGMVSLARVAFKRALERVCFDSSRILTMWM